jgi:Tol biopolymer transport system component
MHVRGLVPAVVAAAVFVTAGGAASNAVRTIAVERGPIRALAASGDQLAWLRADVARGRVAVQNVRTGRRILIRRRLSGLDGNSGLAPVRSLAFAQGRLLYALWGGGGNTGSWFYVATATLKHPREHSVYFTEPDDRPYAAGPLGDEDPGPWPMASDGRSLAYVGKRLYRFAGARQIAIPRPRVGPYLPVCTSVNCLLAVGGGRVAVARFVSRGGCICNVGPVWSPGGSELAYVSGAPLCCDLGDGPPAPTQIRIVRGDGSSRVLAAGDDPAWAPGGGSLAFDRIVKGVSSAYVVQADGSGVRSLGRGARPAWSPAGDVIALERAEGTGSAIWVVRPDGTGLRRVASGTVPSWSPDGSRIAFMRNARVYVIASDGTGEHQVGLGGAPSWSPDGQRLAFSNYDRVLVADAVGPVAARTVAQFASPRSPGRPVWSPDGQRLAFSVSDVDEYLERLDGSEIWVVRSDGSDLHAFAHGREASDPAWSPNGDRLAYAGLVSPRQPADDTPSTEIFSAAASPEGAGETRLTTTSPADPSGRGAARGFRRRTGATFRYGGVASDVTLTPSFAAILAEGFFGKRLYLFDARTGRLRRTVSVPADTGASISGWGHEVAYAAGAELRLLDAKTGATSKVATAARAPLDLVLFRRGLAWIEDTRSRGVLKLLPRG